MPGNSHQRRQARCRVTGFQLIAGPEEDDLTDVEASSLFRGFEWHLRTQHLLLVAAAALLNAMSHLRAASQNLEVPSVRCGYNETSAFQSQL